VRRVDRPLFASPIRARSPIALRHCRNLDMRRYVAAVDFTIYTRRLYTRETARGHFTHRRLHNRSVNGGARKLGISTRVIDPSFRFPLYIDTFIGARVPPSEIPLARPLGRAFHSNCKRPLIDSTQDRRCASRRGLRPRALRSTLSN
jgi:hypothetical protein